ncbi:MAG TPA: HYR domain-containing protein, partial [Gaiellaceae bacterium]|nr:HYR domain-containing protein [Gaiellaceae bacterium]
VDTTPPALSGLPAGLTADATGPDGAAVSYAAPTATDLVDGSVPVDCSPASGSTFAIGDTTVTCTATDAHGNAASAAFSVHVRGAGEQLADLLAYVTGIGPGKSLAAKVLAAQRALARGDAATAVSDLDALDAETSAQDGKKLTGAQAAAIEAAVARIGAVLGF